MNVLDEIVLNTKSKLEVMKSKTSLEELISQVTKLKIKKSNFKASLASKDQAIIAEIKKASPSAGVIIKDYDLSLIHI